MFCKKSKSKEYYLAVSKTRDEELGLKWKDLDDEFAKLDKKGDVRNKGQEEAHGSRSLRAHGRRQAVRVFEDVDDVVIKIHDKSAPEKEEIRKAIKKNEFLNNILNQEVVKAIINAMYLKSVNPGEVITAQGDESDEMFITKSGEFEIKINGTVCNTIRGRQVIGELALIYKTPRAATITSRKCGEIYVLERNVFKKIQRNSAQNDDKEILQFLRRVPKIKEATDDKLKQIASICERKYYARDTAIIRQGQPGNEFFIVTSGTAKVSIHGKRTVGTYNRGHFFGERALLEDTARQATVTAGDYGVECLVLSRSDFVNYLGDVETFLKKSAEVRRTINTTVKVDQRFSDIKLEQLRVGRILGTGAFGTVELVEHKESKEKFALKSIKTAGMTQDEVKNSVYNERDIQLECDSVFITRLHCTFVDKEKLYFLLEYCPKGDLLELLKKTNYFKVATARFVAACTLEAIIYMHDRNFLYLDLKPENIFIDKDGYTKLGDFGNAIKLKKGEKIDVFSGTPEYMAPEIYNRGGHDRAADYWALGILIFEMIMGKTPFRANDIETTCKLVTKGLETDRFPQGTDKASKKIILNLCQNTPAKRWGYFQDDGPAAIRNHDWFRGIDWNSLQQKTMKSPLLALLKK